MNRELTWFEVAVIVAVWIGVGVAFAWPLVEDRLAPAPVTSAATASEAPKATGD